MTGKQFFWAVAQMRAAQRAYFATRDPHTLRAAIAAEREIDAEIETCRMNPNLLEHYGN